MLRLATLLSLLPLSALAAGPWQETQSLTRPVPVGAPTDQQSFPTMPMSLDQTGSYRITLCAPVGATLAGTGTLRLWLYNTRAAAWGYNSAFDLAVTTSGVACQSWGRSADVSLGFLLPAAVGVGVSSGTTVRLFIDTVATR